MSRSVHLNYSTQHPGVARVGSAMDAAKQLRHGFSGTRALAKLLLSAIAAAVMVVAYQVMDSVAEGHLLVIWIAMWAAAFVALAVFAGSTLTLAARIKGALDNWSLGVAQKRADQRMWAIAKVDARVMSDLQAAQSRGEWDSESALNVNAPALPARSRVAASSPAVHAFQRYYV